MSRLLQITMGEIITYKSNQNMILKRKIKIKISTILASPKGAKC